MTATQDQVTDAVQIVEHTGPNTERSPVYVMSAIVAAVLLIAGVIVAKADRDALAGFEKYLLDFVDGLPETVERFLIGLGQFVAVISPLVAVIVFVIVRHVRTLWVGAIAGGVAALGAIGLEKVLDLPVPAALAAAERTNSWLLGGAFPSASYIAGAAAVAVVMGAHSGRTWGRAGWYVVLFLCVVRVLAGADVPIQLFLAVVLGWLVGAVTLLAVGSPIRRPDGVAIAAALTRSGFELQRLAPAAVDARGSTPWFATTTDGRSLFVKTLGRDERDADLIFSIYRKLRLRNVGDSRPFASLQRAVEHEALISLKARDIGVRTPHLLTVATADPDGVLIVYEGVNGSSLDSLEETWSDELLRGIWEQVAIIRRDRIAHRDLRQANVFVTPDDEPWLIDFGFSELAATNHMLDQDVAQLLAATSLAVGVERAVAAAVDVLGPDEVASSLAYMQTAAFAGATRAALSKHKDLLPALRTEVMHRTGAEEVQYEPLQRFKLRSVLILVSSFVAFYVLIPQLADVNGMIDQLHNASWELVLVTVFFAFVTYLGAALSLTVADPVQVSYFNAFEVSLAGSFVNRITPAGSGGIGLNLRFMQKSGANTVEAASRWGVNAGMGFLVHVSLTLLFAIWAKNSHAFHLSLPETPILTAVVIIGVVGFIVVFVLPIGRKKLLGPLLKVLGHAKDGVVDVARRPSQLALMGLGGLGVTLGSLLAFYAAVRAFGGRTPLSAVGIVFLTGVVVGSAAPTPGGLGTVEAALIAGLRSVGLESDIAVPAVLLYRLATFWLPILPGWLSFNSLSHRKVI
jgi:undecaprenyl-diphosphatase